MFRIPLLPMKNQNASFFICNMEKEVFILKQLYLTIKDSVKESREKWTNKVDIDPLKGVVLC